jgi:peptide deformylase
MAVIPVVKMGNPQLATPSEAVHKFATPELRTLAGNMLDTMRATSGVGIAAPQIGVNRRVVIFGFENNERYPNEEPIPLTTLINPRIEILSEIMEEGWEGCLSVPGIRGLVPRYENIRYHGYDIEGHAFAREASGFHARVVQHECDHLEGILFPQRITDMRNFGFEGELGDIVCKPAPRNLQDSVSPTTSKGFPCPAKRREK